MSHPFRSFAARTACILLGASVLGTVHSHGAGESGKTSGKGPIQVFILAGQSNMEGKGVVSADDPKAYNGGKGNLVWSMEHSKSADNLVNLVKDLRAEFKTPDLPVVVGELGNGGPTTGTGAMADFRKQQELGTRRIRNAVFVKTTQCARPAELSPNVGHGHHWFGNAESYFLVGEALGVGMKGLLK